MSNKEIIRNYIQQNMNVFEDIELSDSDNIFEKGFVNSLFAMKLLTFIENEFKIIVNDDEIGLANFSSVDNMINLIDKKHEYSK